MRIKTTVMISMLVLFLATLSTAHAQVDWVADPFEEARGEYFVTQVAIGDFPITYEPEVSTPNSALALRFEYSDGSLVEIPFDDVNLINVSLQVDGAEIAKYPAEYILEVARREMKQIIEETEE